MISVDALLEWLHAEESDYEEIARLRDAAVAYINEPGGRYFGPVKTITDTFTYGGGTFLLSSEPIGGTYAVSEWDGSTWSASDSSGYVRDGRLLYAANTYSSRSPRRFQFTYEAGYELDDDGESLAVPEDIKQAVRMIVADWFLNREGKAENRLSAGINVAVDAILRKYR